MTVANLELSILWPAFLAGVLVLSTHVPLGQRVLARGIVFIDLAIAQIAGLGVTLAAFYGYEAQGWMVQGAATGAALFGALILTLTEKIWTEVQEALIGVMFVFAACLELLLLANNPHGGEHLKDMLVGQILWVSPVNLIPTALFYAFVLNLWFYLRGAIAQWAFYLIFALVVTQSVQLVGIYLVFASLIVPALASRSLAPSIQLMVAYAVGIAGYGIGIVLSSLYDLPTGAMIVVALVSLMIICLIFGKLRDLSLRV